MAGPIADLYSCASGGTIRGGKTIFPSWRFGMAVGEWRSISGTNISSVAPTPTPAGGTGPRSKVDAWCSFVVDHRTSMLYSVAGGGHGDYSGNEVDRILLNQEAPTWAQIRAPSAAADVVQNVDYYNDGRPSARHSYYGVVLVEQNDEIQMLGGNVYGATGILTRDVAAFDLLTSDWKPNGTRPDMPAGTTTVQAHATALDPVTGDIYILTNQMVNKWARASNSWSNPVIQYLGPYGQEAMSALDSTRNRVLVIGGLGNETVLYTVGLTNGAAISTPTLSGGEASSISTQDGAAMVYDQSIDKYLVRLAGSGGTVYQVNPATFEVTQFSTTGGASIPAATNGPYNKFLRVPALGGCVYVPSYTGNVWFLRTH